MSPDKVELGRRLFYDIRLSGPGYMACATCHVQKLGFAEARRVSIGVTGEHHRRNAMTLANVAYFRSLTWANPLERNLEKQLLRPLFGTKPVEMGASGHENAILTLLRSNSVYVALFRKAFPEYGGRIDFPTVGKAIAAFQRTLISARAPYDRYKFGNEPTALSPAARRGEVLFTGKRLKCAVCHAPPFFNNVAQATGLTSGNGFHNTGLYNVDGKGGLPKTDAGLAETTGKPGDTGRFRTPSLRNIAVSAPYMHDGSLKTLGAVIDHYQAGGRSAQAGRPSPLRSPLISGFEITQQERADLIAFLESLTDHEFLTDPRLASPFK